jgi:HSP20 family molecular chaperone IbpA
MSAEEIEVKRVGKSESASDWCYCPDVDVWETADGLTVMADMPGSSGPMIDVRFESGVLKMRGRVRSREPKQGEFLIQEFGVGDFERELRIYEAIDAERIEAEYANGVLTVRLPKAAAARPRQIQVKAT